MNTYSGIDNETMERCQEECICPDLVLPIIGRILSTLDAERVAQLFSVLADPTRIRILHALTLSSELCVCDLAFLVGVSQSAVSHQLRSLRMADVVARRKEGRTMFYSLSDSYLRIMLNNGFDHLGETHSHARD